MRWLAGICLVALTLLCVAVVLAPRPRLEVVNASGRPLDDVQIWIGDQKAQVDALAPAAVAGKILPMRREGPIRAQLQFADGSRSEVVTGWFSPGMVGTARLTVVGPDSVRFELR